MKIGRSVTNGALDLGLVLSIFVLIVSAWNWEWNTVAATLAVITAIVSAWATQKIIWKQEDDQEPLLEIYFDTHSRQGLTLLVLQNSGGSNAYDIMIKWEKPLFNLKGEEVHFGRAANKIEIQIINRGQKYFHTVNGTQDMFQKSKEEKSVLDFSGKIYYKRNRENDKYSEMDFFISLEPYRGSPLIETDQINFYYEAAKIHSDLKKISSSLAVLIDGLKISRIPKRKSDNLNP